MKDVAKKILTDKSARTEQSNILETEAIAFQPWRDAEQEI